MIFSEFFLLIKKISILVILISLTSCVSANLNYSPVDSEIDDGNYSEAIRELNSKSGYYYKRNDKVLFYLDSGLLQHFAHCYEESNEKLQSAEVEIEKNFTESITQKLGQFIINDTVADYTGEAYEDIYTNIFKCLNYIQLNNLEDAMVEIRRFDNKMKVIGHEYEAVIESQKLNASSDEEKNILKSIDADVKFHNSAFARYLSMLLYRSSGDYYSAKIDYEKIQDAFRFQPELYNFPIPENLEEELEFPEGKARVNVICFTGKSPVKYEEVIRLPFNSTYYKFAIPVMYKRTGNVNDIEVDFISLDMDHVYRLKLDVIESIENIALDTYKQHFAAIYARAAVRSITKALQTGIYDNIAENTSDDNLRGIFTLLNFASRITTEVTEQADTRCSRYFPANACVGGINIPEGIYNVRIRFFNSKNEAVMSVMIPDYEAKAGELNLIEETFQR